MLKFIREQYLYTLEGLTPQIASENVEPILFGLEFA